MSLYDHSIRHLHGARSLQLGHELDDGIAIFIHVRLTCFSVHLRHSDFDKTLAAVGRCGHRRMIAEVRKVYAVVQAELEKLFLPLKFECLVVNCDFGHDRYGNSFLSRWFRQKHLSLRPASLQGRRSQ